MNKTILSLSLLFIALAFTGCKGDDPSPVDTFEGIYYEEGTSDREYLETVATKVLSYIRAYDQREAIVALHAFSQSCQNYTFPDNFYDNVDALAPASREVADALENSDYYSLSRAVNNFVYNLARFKGLYQAAAGSDAWQFIEKRDDLTLRFYVGTTEYNFVVSGTGSSWTETINDGNVSYTVEVPQILDFTLMSGSISSPTKLITAKIQTDGKDNDHLDVISSIYFANLQVESTLKATNSSASEDMILYVHDVSTKYRTELLAAKARITGNNLCSISAWRRAIESDNAESMFTSVSSTSMLYKSIQIQSNVTNFKTFVDNAFSYWDTDVTANAESEAKKAASALSSSVTAELHYCSSNEGKVRGTLGWEAYMDYEGVSYKSWAVRPTLTFTSDGATFDIESYFGNNRFMSVENTLKSLIRSYESYWK